MGDKLDKFFGLKGMTSREEAAWRKEQEMHAALQRRGKELGLSQTEISRVRAEAQKALRRRGMTWWQQEGDNVLDRKRR